MLTTPTEAMIREAKEYADQTSECCCDPNHFFYGERCWFHMGESERCREAYLAGRLAERNSPEVQGLIGALEVYSAKKYWDTDHVCDSWSGSVGDIFSGGMRGDLQEAGYETAEKALRDFEGEK